MILKRCVLLTLNILSNYNITNLVNLSKTLNSILMKNSNRGTQKGVVYKMGLFKNIGEFFNKKAQEGEDKRKAFTEEHLNKYLNSTGMAKTKAKGKLLYGYCLYPKFKFDYVGGHPSHP